ncbi:MAG: DNA repair protein RadC [Candidatus Woesearchaeota archaeon]
MKIQEVPHENRPRERCIRSGPQALSTAELLALIFQSGTQKVNVIDVANTVIRKIKLERLADTTINELTQIQGIGQVKALQLQSIGELARRIRISRIKEAPITCAHDVYKRMAPSLTGLTKEHFIVLHLNAKNQVTKEETVSIGTLTASIIHPREIFRAAIKENANGIILVHNHPSGNPNPSDEDRIATDKLKKAADTVQIPILDHVIIGHDTYFSFNRE